MDSFHTRNCFDCARGFHRVAFLHVHLLAPSIDMQEYYSSRIIFAKIYHHFVEIILQFKFTLTWNVFPPKMVPFWTCIHLPSVNYHQFHSLIVCFYFSLARRTCTSKLVSPIYGRRLRGVMRCVVWCRHIQVGCIRRKFATSIKIQAMAHALSLSANTKPTPWDRIDFYSTTPLASNSLYKWIAKTSIFKVLTILYFICWSAFFLRSSHTYSS